MFHVEQFGAKAQKRGKMQFQTVGKIEAIPSAGRGLEYLWLDVAKKRLVATDGFCLVVLQVEPEEGDISGAIPIEAFKYARTLAKNVTRYGPRVLEFKCGADIEVVDLIGKTTTKYERPNVGSYVNYEAVLPEMKPDTPPTVAFDYAVLKRAIDAIGDASGSGVPKSVAIWVTDRNSPIVVKTTPDGPMGIVMPVKADPQGWKLTLKSIEQIKDEKRAKAKRDKEEQQRAQKVAAAGTKGEPPKPDEDDEEEGDEPEAAVSAEVVVAAGAAKIVSINGHAADEEAKAS